MIPDEESLNPKPCLYTQAIVISIDRPSCFEETTPPLIAGTLSVTSCVDNQEAIMASKDHLTEPLADDRTDKH